MIGRDPVGVDLRRRRRQERRPVSNASIVDSAPRSSSSSVGVASVIENVRLSPWKIAYLR